MQLVSILGLTSLFSYAANSTRVPDASEMYQDGLMSSDSGVGEQCELKIDFEEKLFSESVRGYDVSLGLPHHGRLRNGVAIESNVCLESRSSNHFGTQEIADLLNDTACSMYQLTGARLSIDDVSQYGGGRFKPHKSHQNGLDVDIGHYNMGESGMVHSNGYISGNRESMAVTWEFIRELHEQPTKVQYIFWSPCNIRKLKGYVMHELGSQEWEKYGSVFHPERRHKRHMHLRIEKPRSGYPVAVHEAVKAAGRVD